MICLSKEGCLNNNISKEEILLLLILYHELDIDKIEPLLVDKGFITAYHDSPNVKWVLTREGKTILENVIIDSEKIQPKSEENLNALAKELKEIFPKGKKEGTHYYWAEGVALIVRRLKLFFKKYGNNYTNEQIINATKKYVQGFNGNYLYMRLLKYFIFKEKVGANGEIEGDSELISYIENEGQEDCLKDDWTSTLN